MSNSYIQNTIEEISKKFPDFSQLKPLEVQISFHLLHGKFFLKIRFQESFPVNPPVIMASVLASHPMIDIFGIINYSEFETWEENFDLCNILNRIQYEFSLHPPNPLKEKTFPDFQNIIRSKNISIKSENDLIEVVKLTEEYKALETVKNQYIDENIRLAEELIKKKQDYMSRVQENSEKIEEFQKVKEKVLYLEKEVESVHEDFNKNVTPNRLRELEHKSQTEANKVFSQFMHKEIEVNDFIENFISIVKDSKKISLIKNKK